jgi:PAS domain S-box-containing protein
MYNWFMFGNQEVRGFGRPALPLWQRMTACSIGFFLAGLVGSLLSAPHATSANFWLPAGVFVSVLLLNPTRDWPWLALAVLPANLAFDYIHDPAPNLELILIFYCSNVIQAVLGSWLVRRFVAEYPTLCTLNEFWGVMVLGGILSAVVGAIIGAAALTISGLSPSFFGAWSLWWTGVAMAVVVFAPVLLTWLPWLARRNRMRPPVVRGAKKLEAVALFLGLSLSTWYFLVHTAWLNAPKVTLLIFVLWAGLRFGVRGAALTVFWLALLMAFLTTHYMKGVSPADLVSGGYIVTLQINLAVAAFIGLIPAIILGERDEAMKKLRDGEESLRATIENTPYVAVQWYDNRGRVTYWNHASEIIYGWASPEATGKTLDELIFTKDQTMEFQSALSAIEKTGRPAGPMEFSFRRRDGTTGVILSTLFQIQISSGEYRFVCMDVDLTRRIQAEALSHTQVQVLEMIAAGRPMNQTLEALVRMIEAQAPDMLCSILLLDRDGVHFRHGAAPSLPEEYLAAVDGASIGPQVGSCGAAMYRGETVLVADIASDPAWAQYKQLALPYGLRACWSTPIFDLQRKVLGSFAIFRKQTGLPDERHQRLMEMGTHMAAVCIGREWSETGREEAVAREQQARAKYTLQLIAAQEEERGRIAAELHDSLGQNLLLIKNRAQMSLRQGSNPAEFKEQIENIGQLASACIAEARRISHDLRPPLLDHLGLTRALDAMIEKTEHSSEIIFTRKLEPVDGLFSNGAAMNFYRIVQESLNNIMKHSGARQVDIRLERDIHEVQLVIQDDGKGFPAEQMDKSGLGLKNMADRAQMLGGKLKINSRPGQGTRIEVTVPISEKELSPPVAAGGKIGLETA